MNRLASHFSVLCRSRGRRPLLICRIELLISLLALSSLAMAMPTQRASQTTSSDSSDSVLATTPQKTSDTRSLQRDQPVERDIAGGGLHSYELPLTADQFIYVNVDQLGIDVIVTLFGPDERKILEVDNPNGARGVERLVWIAETSGAYRLEVRPAKENAVAGSYEIKLVELRAATEKDRSLVAGEQIFAEAEQLRAQKTAESLKKAIEKYEEALPLFRASGDQHRQAETLTDLGVVYGFLGEKDKAFKYYSEIFPLTKDATEVINVQNIIDLYYTFDKDEKQKAIYYMEQVRLLLRLTNNRYMEVYMLIGLGFVYSDLGENKKALDYFTQALELARSTKNRLGEAYTLTHIGNIHGSQGQKQEAFQYFNQALPLFRAEGDRVGEMYALAGIAYIYFYLSQPQKALDYVNQILAISQKLGDKFTVKSMIAVAMIYDTMGEKQKAIDYYNRAIATNKKFGGDHYWEASAIGSIGDIYYDQGKYAEALEYSERSLKLWRALGFRSSVAHTMSDIGITYVKLGESQKALTYLSQALAIDRETQERSREAVTLNNLMFTWKSLNNPRLAIFYGKQAVNIYQEVRSYIRGFDQGLQKSFVKSREKTYRTLAELLISEGRLTEAQQVLALLKEEEYFEYLRRDGTEANALNGLAALTPKEAELERRYKEISGKVAAIGKERSDLLSKKMRTVDEDQRLAKLESDLSIAAEEFQNFLERLTLEFGNTRQAGRLDQIRESQGMMEDLRELGGGAAALYTIAGEEKYRVILVTPDAQLVREFQIKAADLNSKVLNFREALQDPKVDPVPLAQELYRIVVGPVAEDLKQAHAETLMWSLDGALRYLPIAALHDGNNYMVEKYRNVVFTIASQTRLKDASRGAWSGLGLGVSKAQKDAPALPAVPDELRGIIRQRGASGKVEGVLPGRIILDEAFTEEAMKAELRKRYPLVHIASHFQMKPGNETDSFLLLGDGSHLTLEELKHSSNLFGGVELLTLSACNTATGGVGADGKEVEGFGMLAQKQGAKAVVASLWPVADKSTRLLMQRFYQIRNSHPGMLKAEALRRAQLVLLLGVEKVTTNEERRQLVLEAPPGTRGSAQKAFVKDSKKPYAHPYFWAPFILIGNWK